MAIFFGPGRYQTVYRLALQLSKRCSEVGFGLRVQHEDLPPVIDDAEAVAE